MAKQARLLRSLLGFVHGVRVTRAQVLTYSLVLAVGDERARRSVSPGHATSITEGGMRNELAVLQQARATRRA